MRKLLMFFDKSKKIEDKNKFKVIVDSLPELEADIIKLIDKRKNAKTIAQLIIALIHTKLAHKLEKDI